MPDSVNKIIRVGNLAKYHEESLGEIAELFTGEEQRADGAYVGDISYDTTNKKLKKTKNGSTSELVSASLIVSDGLPGCVASDSTCENIISELT